jgi:hypothetical protein
MLLSVLSLHQYKYLTVNITLSVFSHVLLRVSLCVDIDVDDLPAWA